MRESSFERKVLRNNDYDDGQRPCSGKKIFSAIIEKVCRWFHYFFFLHANSKLYSSKLFIDNVARLKYVCCVCGEQNKTKQSSRFGWKPTNEFSTCAHKPFFVFLQFLAPKIPIKMQIWNATACCCCCHRPEISRNYQNWFITVRGRSSHEGWNGALVKMWCEIIIEYKAVCQHRKRVVIPSSHRRHPK